MVGVLFNELNSAGLGVATYHGGLSKIEREAALSNWIKDHAKIMIATNAFGMGIDKGNVSDVIHFQIPESLENYYQESGKSWQRRKTSKCNNSLGYARCHSA